MIAYLDMPSGISGDMVLGCLVDASWPVEQLRNTLGQLGLPERSWEVGSEEVMRGPLRATLVNVTVREPEAVHRRLHDIRLMIDSSQLPSVVKQRAIATFERLAVAEARVHGSSVEEVHFHEVGALDAIVDIVGAAAGLHALDIDRLYASALPLGEGWVETEHGRLPLPAPATLEVLAGAGAPSRAAPGPGELVTPTGAAIVAQFARFSQPAMSIDRIAVGAGSKEFNWPNVARLWLGEASADGPIVQIDTNIDDMNPQFYPSVSDRLFAAGAVDVWLTPVQMKKGRPGVVLSVLAPASRETELADLLLRETTTLGVRVHQTHRHEAERGQRRVDTPYGLVAVKLKRVGGKVVAAVPEYEDCRRLAEEQGLPVRVVHEAAAAAVAAL
ncbi:MAG: nickel pincer cofactor biosynthesis protein LarC [Phycisphaerales bacterium]|nr:MAG: nickel pincer cofactor biosynthesis protein LarC [Phycisphaerales bacterium]